MFLGIRFDGREGRIGGACGAVGLANRGHRHGVAWIIVTQRTHDGAELFRIGRPGAGGKRCRGVFRTDRQRGRTAPMLTARNGSSPPASSQRPIQPVGTGSDGDAVCQISMTGSGCGRVAGSSRRARPPAAAGSTVEPDPASRG